MALALEVAGRSDIGRVRTSNEDSYGYDQRLGVFVVCDGMGGHAAGEVASKIAVDSVLGYFRDQEPMAADASLIDAPIGARLLADAVNKANESILQYADENEATAGMGTTLVAVRFCEGKFTIAHVGDSRIYLLREGELVQLTEDHSFVMEQVRRGVLTIQEAKQSSAQHIITRALGTGDDSPPDLAEFPAQEGDLLLLTTDGIIRHVSDEEIKTILSQIPSVQLACETLVDAALEGGGEDNATCMLLRVRNFNGQPS